MIALKRYYHYLIYFGFLTWFIVVLTSPSILQGYKGETLVTTNLATKTLIPMLCLISLPIATKEKDYYNLFLSALLILAYPLSSFILPIMGLHF
ncbi:hypothetical protein [Streptococcus fryi]